jgi:hypothetical protein
MKGAHSVMEDDPGGHEQSDWSKGPILRSEVLVKIF